MKSINVNERKFEVERLLGKGKGGYSYLVKYNGKNYVLKQIHHEPCDYYTFGNKIESEINDYKKLRDVDIRIPEMLDVDIKEERIIKEYIEGDTIADIVAKGEMKESYIEQVKEMCKVLYKVNLNIDYYPTNFIVQDGLIYYIDYECNEYMEEWDFEHWGYKYWKSI